MKFAFSSRRTPSALKLLTCAVLAGVITLVTTQSIVHAAMPGYLVQLAAPLPHANLAGWAATLVRAL